MATVVLMLVVTRAEIIKTIESDNLNTASLLV
jgi:hypothetical protein